MMAVPVAAGNVFVPSTPVKLFSNPHLLADTYHQSYDVDSGDRFLMIRSSQKNSQTLGVVINWGAEISRLSSKK